MYARAARTIDAMSHVFVVRNATAADAAVIARHRAEMFRDMGQLPSAVYPDLIEQTISYLSSAIGSGEYVGWLVTVQDSTDVFAGAGVQLRRILPRPVTVDGQTRIAAGREAIVLNVFTERPWRRKGVARLLMEHVLAWASHADIDRLVLHASDEGRVLYEHLGFVLTGEMRYAKPLH
jgi:GNAT superfamily N-acetyltransferase